MQDFLESSEVKIIKKYVYEFIMHKGRQKMAAEPTLPVSSLVDSLTMVDEFWSVCNILKMMDAGSSRQTTNCLFSTILEWLGQPSFEISMFSAPSDLGLF